MSHIVAHESGFVLLEISLSLYVSNGQKKAERDYEFKVTASVVPNFKKALLSDLGGTLLTAHTRGYQHHL